MVFALKIFGFAVVVTAVLWFGQELYTAPLRDDEGNPIPTPKEGQGTEAP